VLLAHSVVATLVLAATSGPTPTAARLAPPPASAAAHSIPAASTVVTAFAQAATTPTGELYEFVGLGTPRGEEAQRGGRKGSARKLYRPTPRDCPALQTRRQVVEGVNTSFISLHQQRNSSFLSFLHYSTHNTAS
jgi:hypothetical protein